MKGKPLSLHDSKARMGSQYVSAEGTNTNSERGMHKSVRRPEILRHRRWSVVAQPTSSKSKEERIFVLDPQSRLTAQGALQPSNIHFLLRSMNQ
mmetsp:Transcript_29928/g.77270  ORF Transcript_29928/g.77270 Transcript_29928/m.77270 type:complete len:94 (-) Transcript_29928:814-1095(-)